LGEFEHGVCGRAEDQATGGRFGSKRSVYPAAASLSNRESGIVKRWNEEGRNSGTGEEDHGWVRVPQSAE
jgi:hypothetical protein